LPPAPEPLGSDARSSSRHRKTVVEYVNQFQTKKPLGVAAKSRPLGRDLSCNPELAFQKQALRSAVSSISPLPEFCRHRYVKTDHRHSVVPSQA
jgi:hypothetical protein